MVVVLSLASIATILHMEHTKWQRQLHVQRGLISFPFPGGDMSIRERPNVTVLQAWLFGILAPAIILFFCFRALSWRLCLDSSRIPERVRRNRRLLVGALIVLAIGASVALWSPVVSAALLIAGISAIVITRWKERAVIAKARQLEFRLCCHCLHNVTGVSKDARCPECGASLIGCADAWSAIS